MYARYAPILEEGGALGARGTCGAGQAHCERAVLVLRNSPRLRVWAGAAVVVVLVALVVGLAFVLAHSAPQNQPSFPKHAGNDGNNADPEREFRWTTIPSSAPASSVIRLLRRGRFMDFTNSQALVCLKGARITFIGDSVTRYEYLNLVYFLSTGYWIYKDGAQPNENQRTFPSWKDFFIETNARLRIENVSSEVCDCFRPSSNKELGKSLENRYWRHRDSGLHVNFLPLLGNESHLHGHSLAYLGLEGSSWPQPPPGCSPGECKPPLRDLEDESESVRKNFWYYPPQTKYDDELFNVLIRLNTTILVMNEGLWSGWRDNSSVKTLIRLGRRLRWRGIRTVWKTTTTKQGSNFDTETSLKFERAFASQLRVGGWTIVDVTTMTALLVFLLNHQSAPWLQKTSDLWIDGVIHFQPFVYRAMNELLLTQLFDEIPGCSALVPRRDSRR